MTRQETRQPARQILTQPQGVFRVRFECVELCCSYGWFPKNHVNISSRSWGFELLHAYNSLEFCCVLHFEPCFADSCFECCLFVFNAASFIRSSWVPCPSEFISDQAGQWIFCGFAVSQFSSPGCRPLPRLLSFTCSRTRSVKKTINICV